MLLDNAVVPASDKRYCSVSYTHLKLFVLPGNLDFELQTDLKKVVFEKVEFEDVCGKDVYKRQP